jgi:hypothetical protein
MSADVPFVVIEQAVDQHKAFWRDVRSIISDEMKKAVQPAIDAAQRAERRTVDLVERVNKMGVILQAVSASVERLESRFSVRWLEEDQRNARLELLMTKLETKLENEVPK